ASAIPPIILDWRKIKGHEEKSTVTNVTINGTSAEVFPPQAVADKSVRVPYENEHLVFRDGVVAGENVIKLDFTSPILTSGSAITRYVDKEDGSEYIYSLFVPSDASTAFPVFDQPDLKARFSLEVDLWSGLGWQVISNSKIDKTSSFRTKATSENKNTSLVMDRSIFAETQPISTYVFAFAAGPFVGFGVDNKSSAEGRHDITMIAAGKELPASRVAASPTTPADSRIYVRSSQAGKFNTHVAEIFRLNTEAVKYFEEYFDYKFPFPKYDLVLIPEFPFGGMEHAGATFLRESAIIFPQEPTRNDHISRALLIFHEASHQWFGDTVTMRWFDDLWLKEGFATFTAYKAMERIMPEMNAWKVFYERVKQAAYQTDSTRGTTAIYQPIANLSSAKSAYGNIVYNKAPAFLRQAEFYLGEDKFQTAVRAFLKKHEFGNAGWEDLVKEFQNVAVDDLKLNKNFPEDKKHTEGQRFRDDIRNWATIWVNQPGLPIVKAAETDVLVDSSLGSYKYRTCCMFTQVLNGRKAWPMGLQTLSRLVNEQDRISHQAFTTDENSAAYFTNALGSLSPELAKTAPSPLFVFANYQDYGYGIFLLDEKSREYVLKNIKNEKDPFLRSMMWGALWDSVREGELDPRVFIETAIKNLPAEQDETMAASIAGRLGTAVNYYLSEQARNEFSPQIEKVFSDKMRTAPTLGERLTFFRSYLGVAASPAARQNLKDILSGKYKIEGMTLRTKDKFDIVTRLLILGDADAPKLLAELEKTETSDDAKRYAYAARAGIATAENKAKYWNDFVSNKEISESWIEAAFVPFNSIRHEKLTLPYLQRALQELPNHKRNRKIFFVNGWLGAFIGGQRSEEALNIINKFLTDNPNLDNDLRLKILENADIIERAVKLRGKYGTERGRPRPHQRFLR
ncbi:MAG TPA: M1 family aminopeptidase, partial [Pyrinomonadaceae bacterium]|nr:M1 family aminopeptidase [Pyrinomonadaceae bacterium]